MIGCRAAIFAVLQMQTGHKMALEHSGRVRLALEHKSNLIGSEEVSTKNVLISLCCTLVREHHQRDIPRVSTDATKRVGRG